MHIYLDIFFIKSQTQFNMSLAKLRASRIARNEAFNQMPCSHVKVFSSVHRLSFTCCLYQTWK